ncbi:MAG: LPP20 family lipoprotein [Selenomonadaceae bacterium]|nr:LPP20 family lipoprotein [Selenomonadaceae bacterium]
MKVSKKLSAALALSMAVSFTATSSLAFAEGVNVNVNINTTQQPAALVQGGDVDWTNLQMIVAVGVGSAPEGMAAGRANALARRAALVDAQRTLAEMIKGVQVDAETTVDMLEVQSDVIRTKVSALIRGFQVMGEEVGADGLYYVKIGVPLFGNNSLASIVIPEVKPQAAPEPIREIDTSKASITFDEMDSLRAENYTGLVIIAANMNLMPTYSPVIYDMDGNAIYGIKNVDSDFAISKGMVEYANSPDKPFDLAETNYGGRVGNHPLVINAESVRSGSNSVNPVNIVVTKDDAERIIVANKSSQFLEHCAVVFVR